MNGVATTVADIVAALRTILFVIVLVFALTALLDWAVRTRRVSPFGATARFCRTVIDPFLAPMERRVIRAGGSASTAPLWTLVLLVVGSILLLTVLNFLQNEIIRAAVLSQDGAAGVVMLLVGWAFSFLRMALLVRVISSWLPISPGSPWIRWSFRVTEPLLAPLRKVVPAIGMMDITPIVAFFLLQLLESAIRTVL